jgi:hypothetical protein
MANFIDEPLRAQQIRVAQNRRTSAEKIIKDEAGTDTA